MTEHARIVLSAASARLGQILPLPLPIPVNRIVVSDRELHTVLAALRWWQGERHHDYGINDIATNGGTCKPLTLDEIDALCERINCGG